MWKETWKYHGQTITDTNKKFKVQCTVHQVLISYIICCYVLWTLYYNTHTHLPSEWLCEMFPTTQLYQCCCHGFSITARLSCNHSLHLGPYHDYPLIMLFVYWVMCVLSWSNVFINVCITFNYYVQVVQIYLY